MKVALFGNRVFANVIKLRWGHTGLRWTLNLRIGVLIREGSRRFGQSTETQGRGPCEHRGRNGSDAATILGMQWWWATTGSWKAQGKMFP